MVAHPGQGGTPVALHSAEETALTLKVISTNLHPSLHMPLLTRASFDLIGRNRLRCLFPSSYGCSLLASRVQGADAVEVGVAGMVTNSEGGDAGGGE